MPIVFVVCTLAIWQAYILLAMELMRLSNENWCSVSIDRLPHPRLEAT